MARAPFVARLLAVAAALGWILLFAAVGVAAALGLGVAIGVAAGREPRWEPLAPSWLAALGSAVTAAAFGLATWFVGHRLNRRPWAALGWGEPRRFAARLAGGVLVGAAMAAVTAGVVVLASGARVSADPAGGFAHQLAPLAAGLLGAALFEELLFRGYPLRRLADAVGPVAATAVLGAGFGAAHLGNPNATALGAVNVALAAVWLAAAFFSSGGMPLAWGLHFGWNAGLALGFEAPVSGFTTDLAFVSYAPGRTPWIDGGSFGPEGGIVATVVFVAGTALLWRWSRARGGARAA
jgi:hypothetical protein